MSRAEADLDQTRRDDIADLEAFEERFPPDAFEDIACALGVGTERPSLEALRDWLREDLRFFCSGGVADKNARAKRRHELTKRAQSAAALLAALRSGSLLHKPRALLLDEPFHEKFMGVLEELALPRRAGGRHQPKDGFRRELVPGLVWIYEHITGEKARKPHWLRGSQAYGGKFYRFACAVRRCLYDRVPKVRAALPASDDALAQELKDHWPDSDETTG